MKLACIAAIEEMLDPVRCQYSVLYGHIPIEIMLIRVSYMHVINICISLFRRSYPVLKVKLHGYHLFSLSEL